MKMLKLLVGAVLAGGVFSTSALASVDTPTPWPQLARTDQPTVTRVVNPTGLPQRVEGATVDVAFVIDRAGQPHNIRLLGSSDPALVQRLLPAIAQWRFTPAQKKGAPVASYVVMPIKLVAGA